MSKELKEEIRDELVEDESTISMYLPEIKEYISLTKQGKPIIKPEYASVSDEIKILLYTIGKKLSFEGGLTDNPEIENETVYKLVDVSKSQARNLLSKLREKRFLYSETQGKHSIYIETIPRAVEYIKKEVEENE